MNNSFLIQREAVFFINSNYNKNINKYIHIYHKWFNLFVHQFQEKNQFHLKMMHKPKSIYDMMLAPAQGQRVDRSTDRYFLSGSPKHKTLNIQEQLKEGGEIAIDTI